MTTIINGIKTIWEFYVFPMNVIKTIEILAIHILPYLIIGLAIYAAIRLATKHKRKNKE